MKPWIESIIVTIILLFIISFFTSLNIQILLGVGAIISGIFWILRKDKLKYGFCSNWSNLAFYVWGGTCIFAGIVIIVKFSLLYIIVWFFAIEFFILRFIHKKKKQ